MDPFLLEINTVEADDTAPGERHVHVRGEVDMSTAGRLGEFLDEVISAGATRVVVDMAEVSFLDSTGLRVLVDTAALLERARGSVVVEPMSPNVHRVLEMTGLLDRFAA